MTAESRITKAWLRKGWLACLLWPWSLVYRLIWRLSALGRAANSGAMPWSRARQAAAQAGLPPVVVVGNLIAGGAGKTPTVLALADALRQAGHRPGLISRGYGGRLPAGTSVLEVQPDTPATVCGDEPLLLARRSRLPMFVGADRRAAAAALCAAHPDVDVLISDDGLQHLALPRSAQLLVFDERGVGNGWLLPAGPLREPLSTLVTPPDAQSLPLLSPYLLRGVPTWLVFNAAHAPVPFEGEWLHRELPGLIPLGVWQQSGPAGAANALTPLAAWRDTHKHAISKGQVMAAAGLAHPQKFFQMLKDQGLLLQTLALPDHFDWLDAPLPPDTQHLIVTEKDAVKLRDEGQIPARVQVWVAPLQATLPDSLMRGLLDTLSAARLR